MSDFDKEAEREKLREKYERDQQKRKETERMSQLLLQGATMTNRHCDTCGDPLFRYQGNQFCATCEGRAQEAEAASQSQPGSQPRPESQMQDTGQGTDGAKTAGTTDGQGATVSPGDTGTPDLTDDDATGDAGVGEDTEPTPNSRDTPARAAEDETDAVEADAPRESTETRPHGVGEPSTVEASVRTTRATRERGDDADLDAARASLIRTLTHHARRAEAVEDPRRATDHLTAVREAADALSALGGRR